MASRKRRNINILKYFMAVRNCINVFSFLRVRGLRLCRRVRTSASYVTAGNLNPRMNPSLYLFQFLKEFRSRFYYFYFNSNLQPLG